MTYEGGHPYGPPMAVAPINQVRKVLDYTVTAIPREKAFMGIPNYGYNWILPYTEGRAAKTLSNTQEVNIAAKEREAIKNDQESQSPFFNYADNQRRRYEVWFEDARNIGAKLRLVDQYNLGGISYWTIGRYFPQNWLVLRSLFNIRKVI